MRETANRKDCTANPAPLPAQKSRKTAIRPDGGVVTQRTANPRPTRRNPDNLAASPVCSDHGFPPRSEPTANFPEPIRCYYKDGEYSCTLYWVEGEGWRAEYPPEPEPRPRAPIPQDVGEVYFVAGEVGPIKIGTALHPTTRLAALQVGSPVRLSMLATSGGGMAQERAYHAEFAAFRLHGEWFERAPEILAEIDRLNGGTS